MKKSQLLEFIQRQDEIIEAFKIMNKNHIQINDNNQELIAIYEDVVKSDRERIEGLRSLVKKIAELLRDESICDESKIEVADMILNMEEIAEKEDE